MEQTKLDRMNGSPAPGPEPFSLRDNATGKIRAVREMTDAELVRHAGEWQITMQNHTQQLQTSINGMSIASQYLAVLQYEHVRRQRSIAIASVIPAH